MWENELINDPDRDFLLDGIRHGFRITDENKYVTPVETDNYKSATNDLVYQTVEKQIISELNEGNYKISPGNTKPTLVSALGAVPKPDGKSLRLIHDGSQPDKFALNDYAQTTKFSYQSLEDATNLLKPGYFMAKVDLSQAYRAVPIHPDDYETTGLKWKFSSSGQTLYMFDSKLPFGAKRSPMIFHRLTQSVKRMMARRGFSTLIVYLDDFLIIAESAEECLLAQNILIQLLRQLGFKISWSKVEGPSTKIVFLGIQICSVTMSLCLPKQKVGDFKQTLLEFHSKTRASKRQLQMLAGKLNWACQVVRGGRTFLRRILDTINRLNKANHKYRLSKSFYDDINWWLNFIDIFNNRCFSTPSKSIQIETDACNSGAGLVWNRDWYYVNWNYDMPIATNLHINYKETLAIFLAAKRWGHLWKNCKVTVLTDSNTARAIINKGTCRNPFVMQAMRELFWYSVIYNFELHAVYVKGANNVLADTVSRLSQVEKRGLLCALLYPPFSVYSINVFLQQLRFHTSFITYSFIFMQIQKYVSWNRNLTGIFQHTEVKPLL